jgi:membrane protein
VYIANFTDYEGSYGTVGGVIVVLLWFYVSGMAILVGAELNAEMEHASPYGKAPGQKNADGKLLIGRRAARLFQERQRSVPSSPSKESSSPSPSPSSSPPPSPKPGLAVTVMAGLIVVARLWNLLRSSPPRR